MLPPEGCAFRHKKICSPSPSQTQSRSKSQSPSLSQTPSVTPSLTSTMSQSPSQTQSASGTRSETLSGTSSVSVSPSLTQSQTPSLSASESVTPTNTQSQSQSPSQLHAPSVTPTQTGSGFPLQVLFDNTQARSRAINAAASSLLLGPDDWLAVSFFFPEVDPVCGPGLYRLDALSLALSLNSTSSSGSDTVTVTALLYPATPAGVPRTNTGYLATAFLTFALSRVEPGYVTVALPPSWIASTTGAGQCFSIALYTNGEGNVANWFPPDDGSTTSHSDSWLRSCRWRWRLAFFEFRGHVDAVVHRLPGCSYRSAKDGLFSFNDP